jgi:hypothetical protein
VAGLAAVPPAGTVLLVAAVGVASALPTFATIDGQPGDWTGTTHPPAAICVPDTAVDDEASPIRADITDNCLHIDAGYLYTLMAWDDTGIQGSASMARVRIDVTGDGLFDFIVLATLSGSPAQLDEFAIGTCPGGDCGNSQEVCAGTATGPGTCTCTVGPTTHSAAAAAGITYPDYWGPAGRNASNCSGPDCLVYDAFVELAIPWQILPVPDAPAGTYYDGPPAPFTLGTYGSYPSGPAQAPKDVGGGYITCLPTGICFESTPTAITLTAQQVKSGSAAGWLASAGLLSLMAAGSTAVVLARRRRD